MEELAYTESKPKSNCMHLSYTFVAIRWRK
jgi:hypothetical protein